MASHPNIVLAAAAQRWAQSAYFMGNKQVCTPQRDVVASQGSVPYTHVVQGA